MSAGFSLKKIKTKATLGQKLKRARKRRKISLIDAELGTKIRSKYLLALEKDDWLNLPAQAYTKGFVIRYARFLELDEEKYFQIYQKERAEFSHRRKDYILPIRSFHESKVIITPKLIVPTVISTLVFSVFAYLVFQIYGFAAAPNLQIITPENNSIFENEDMEIKGITDQNAEVYINKENIAVSAQGKFRVEYKLHRGVNVIEVKSMNKTDKEKTITYTIEYRPATAKIETQSE